MRNEEKVIGRTFSCCSESFSFKKKVQNNSSQNVWLCSYFFQKKQNDDDEILLRKGFGVTGGKKVGKNAGKGAMGRCACLITFFPTNRSVLQANKCIKHRYITNIQEF